MDRTPGPAGAGRIGGGALKRGMPPLLSARKGLGGWGLVTQIPPMCKNIRRHGRSGRLDAGQRGGPGNEGDYKGGEGLGRGRFVYKGGKAYDEGEWKDGKRQGYGRCHSATT